MDLVCTNPIPSLYRNPPVLLSHVCIPTSCVLGSLYCREAQAIMACMLMAASRFRLSSDSSVYPLLFWNQSPSYPRTSLCCFILQVPVGTAFSRASHPVCRHPGHIGLPGPVFPCMLCLYARSKGDPVSSPSWQMPLASAVPPPSCRLPWQIHPQPAVAACLRPWQSVPVVL